MSGSSGGLEHVLCATLLTVFTDRESNRKKRSEDKHEAALVCKTLASKFASVGLENLRVWGPRDAQHSCSKMFSNVAQSLV